MVVLSGCLPSINIHIFNKERAPGGKAACIPAIRGVQGRCCRAWQGHLSQRSLCHGLYPPHHRAIRSTLLSSDRLPFLRWPRWTQPAGPLLGAPSTGYSQDHHCYIGLLWGLLAIHQQALGPPRSWGYKLGPVLLVIFTFHHSAEMAWKGC